MKISISAITLCMMVVLSGCSTTQKMMNSVGLGKSNNSVAKKSSVEQFRTPLAIVLNERPDLSRDLATVEIRQYFNRVESPTVAEVKLTETGLLDDSVKSIRTIYTFKKIEGKWTRVEMKKEYQCARKNAKNTFQTKKCS